MSAGFAERLREHVRRAERARLRGVWALQRREWGGPIALPRVAWKPVAVFGVSLIVIIVAAGSVVGQLMGAGRDPLGHVHRLIDVRTGEVYEWNTLKTGGVILPARHPQSGVISLVPISEVEPGRWGVSEHDLQLLQRLDQGVEVKAVDPVTGLVTSTTGGVRTYSRFNSTRGNS